MKFAKTFTIYILLPCLVIFIAALLYYPPFYQKDFETVNGDYFPITEYQDSIPINTAPKEELMLLPGIGEAKAEAIIEYRNLNGKFSNLDELDKVKGIGPSILSRLEGKVDFS